MKNNTVKVICCMIVLVSILAGLYFTRSAWCLWALVILPWIIEKVIC